MGTLIVPESECKGKEKEIHCKAFSPFFYGKLFLRSNVHPMAMRQGAANHPFRYAPSRPLRDSPTPCILFLSRCYGQFPMRRKSLSGCRIRSPTRGIKSPTCYDYPATRHDGQPTRLRQCAEFRRVPAKNVAYLLGPYLSAQQFLPQFLLEAGTNAFRRNQQRTFDKHSVARQQTDTPTVVGSGDARFHRWLTVKAT